MKSQSKFVRVLLDIGKTIRLALPKIGVGWMFTLLFVDFNRIAIHELGVVAILVTSLLAMHYFLSPFQVVFGRLADRNPIFGLRRTPYILVAGLAASLVFVALPGVLHSMADGALWAFGAAIGLFAVYGIAIAAFGDSHHSLIAETTEPRSRGAVMSIVQIVTITSTIFSAVAMNIIAPEYTPESMQFLYGLTPAIVLVTAAAGVIGLEKRLKGKALEEAMELSRTAAPEGGPFEAARKVLSENKQARAFFAFVAVAIFSIFLQDSLLEVYGAEVFGMEVSETRSFQPMWGGGVLVGMLIMGLVSVIFNIKKRTITLIGSVGTALGMGVMAFAALTVQEFLVMPALIGMGFFTGFFNVGALSMMMDMTVTGATGLYMGLWGMAQAFGNAMASLSSGGLHTGLIETGLLAPNTAYFMIFGIESIGMLVAVALMWRISIKGFQNTANRFTGADIVRSMEASAAR